MDRMQIALKLSLDTLGIEANVKNYRQICDIAYMAEQRGIYISPSRIAFNEKIGHAYSPMSHEDGGWPSRNLYDDLEDIERAIKAGSTVHENFTLDEKTKEALKDIKEEMGGGSENENL